MNDERLEGLVRSRLRAMAPQDVPPTLLIRAAAIPETARRRDRRPGLGSRPAPRLRLGLAFVAVLVALLAIGIVPGRFGQPGVAAPSIPTLPPMRQPSLPPAAANPTRIMDGAWVTATTAWLVDANGGLHMTLDGGLTWSEARPLPQADLRGSPTFLDGSFGYAMWAKPDTSPVRVVLYLTHDGGRTWSSVTVGSLPSATGDSNSLTAHFVDAQHGVVLAGDYRSTPVPSGQPWTGLEQAACAGWSTDDGGRSWATLPNPPCSDHDQWASPTVGIIYPSGAHGPRVSITVDGGRNWQQGALPGVAADDLPYVIVFSEGGDGTLRAGYRVVRRSDSAGAPQTLVVAQTRDQGVTWQEAYAAPLPVLGPVTALGPEHWLGSGLVPTGGGLLPAPILETADGGRTWTTVGALGDIDGRAIGWFDRLHGVASGQDDSGCATPSGTPCHSDGFFLTNDGGVTWHGIPF